VNARLTILLATATAIGAIAAGCGGGGNSSTSASTGGITVTTSSLGKAAFIKKAEAACDAERGKLIPEIDAYFKKYGSKLPEPVLIVKMLQATLVPIVEAEIADVRKLGAPAGDEEEIAAMLAAQQKAVERVKKMKRAPATEAVESNFVGATKLYRAYGFDACTSSPNF